MTWKVAHACVRGSSHVRSGLPNQDAAQCSVTPSDSGSRGTAVVAVSDGHGGARHFRSQIGSSLAVSTAITLVQQFLPNFAGEDGAAKLSAEDVQGLQQSLVDAWIAAVGADLKNNPLTEEELLALESEGPEVRSSVEDSPAVAYGATLLVAAATENMVLYLQLGDGEILSVAADGETTRPLPGDERLVGNQTTSLCQPDAWREFRIMWVTAPWLPALVLLSTDGYANSFRSDEDFLKIGQDYLEILREQGIAILAEELPEILKEATQQGSGDDITLAILQGDLRKGPADPEPAQPIRPKISNESRSALIEHLKARHSSQHRRIDELASRLEHTRTVNRRLQTYILLLALAGAAICAYSFRDRLFPAHIAIGGETKPDPASGKNNKKPLPSAGTPGSDDRGLALPTSWELTFKKRGPIALALGKLAASRVVGGTNNDDYAEVAEQIDADGKTRHIILINRSGDTWLSWKGKDSKTARKVPPGQQVELNAEPKTIKFRDGVTGTVTPHFETSAARETQAAAESGP